MQLLDVGRQPPELAGDRGEQRVPHTGLGRDQFAEAISGQHDRLGRAERCGAGRPRRPVQQCELTEHIAGTQRREDRLVAGLRRQRDLDVSGDDHEQGIPGVTEVEDHLSPTEAARAHRGREPFHGLGPETCEERDRGQCLADRPTHQHAADGNRVELPTHLPVPRR